MGRGRPLWAINIPLGWKVRGQAIFQTKSIRRNEKIDIKCALHGFDDKYRRGGSSGCRLVVFNLLVTFFFQRQNQNQVGAVQAMNVSCNMWKVFSLSMLTSGRQKPRAHAPGRFLPGKVDHYTHLSTCPGEVRPVLAPKGPDRSAQIRVGYHLAAVMDVNECEMDF